MQEVVGVDDVDDVGLAGVKVNRALHKVVDAGGYDANPAVDENFANHLYQVRHMCETRSVEGGGQYFSYRSCCVQRQGSRPGPCFRLDC